MKFFNKSFIFCLIISISVILFSGCSCSQEIKIETISFDSPVVDLFVGDIYQTNINVLPSNAQNQKIVYGCENPKNDNGATLTVLKKNTENSFIAVNPGEATIYATAVSLGSSSTIVQTIRVFAGETTLNSPTGIKYDGEKVVWNKVTYSLNNKSYDALGYIVNLNGEDKTISTNNYFNNLPVGVVNKIKVKASENGSDYIKDSSYSSEITVYILNAPSNIVRNGTIVSWDPVDYAGSYDIYVNGELYSENITTNNIDIDFENSGNYALNIVANPIVNNEYMYPSFMSETLSIEKLETVNNISIDDNIVTWNEVVKAVEYKLILTNENNIYSYNTGIYTNFDLSSLQEIIESGEYNLSIVAVSNTTTGINSNKSEPLIITKLATPTNLRIENNALVWDDVEGAEKYALTINGGEIINVKSSYTLPDSVDAGSYIFKMIAYGNGKTTFTSNWTRDEDEFTAYKLAKPETIYNVNNVVKSNKVDNAFIYAYYDVANDDEIIRLADNDISIELINDEVNTTLTLQDKIDYSTNYDLNLITQNYYKIKIQALGENGGNCFNSDLSDAYVEFYKLFSPSEFSILYPCYDISLTFCWSFAGVGLYDEKALEILKNVELDYGQYFVNLRFQQMEDGKLVDRFIHVIDGTGEGISKESMDKLVGGDIYISICSCGDGQNLLDSEYKYISLAQKWNCNLSNGIFFIQEISDEPITLKRMYTPTNLETNGTMLTFNSQNEGEEEFSIYAENVEEALVTDQSKSIDLDTIITTAGQFTLYIKTEPKDNTEYTFENGNVEYGEDNIIVGTINLNDKFRLDSLRKEFTITRLSAPILTVENGYVCFEQIEGADRYDVYVNGVIDNNAQIYQEDGKYKYYCNNYLSSQLQIQVVAVVERSQDENNLKISSKLSEPVIINRLAINGYNIVDDNLIIDTYEENVLLKLIAVNVNNGNILRKSYDSTVINLSEAIKDAGDYNIGFYLSLKEDAVQDKLDSYLFGSVYPITIKILNRPNISYNDKNYKISFINNEHANGYRLVYKEKDSDDIQISNLFTTNEIDLSTFKAFNGNTTYNVTVMCVGNGKQIISSYVDFESNTVEFTGLQEPTNLKGIVNENNYILTWDSVQNATYKVFVNDVEIASVSENNYIYPLNYMDTPNSYIFTVRAISNDKTIAPSKFSDEFIVVKLDAPYISIVNGQIKLNNFDSNISSALFKLFNSNNELVYSFMYDTDIIDLDDIIEIGTGIYKIVVCFVGDNINYISSESSSLENISRTKSVTNLSLNSLQKRLEWSSINGIEKYKVVYENESGESVYEIVNTNYSTIFDDCIEGINTVRVYSIGKENQINALPSNAITLTKISSPLNIRIEDDLLKFDKVLDFTNYTIKIVKDGNISYQSYEYTISGYQLDLTKVGNYSISVCVKGDYITTINSSYSQSINVYKLEKVDNININNGTISFNEVQNASGYKLLFSGTDNFEKIIYSNSYVIELDKFIAGNYNLTICALGDDLTTINGESLTLYNFIVAISKPTNVKFNEEKELTWDEVQNATEYEIELVGEENQNILLKINTNKLQIPTYLNNGQYYIYVKALGNNQEILNSLVSDSLIINKLRTPFNAEHKAGVITVKEMQGIEDYVIVITDENQNIVEKEVNISNLTTTYDFANDGIYNISVYAKGNYVNSIDSSLSSGIQVIRLKDVDIQIENDRIVWEENEYAKVNKFGYAVTIYKEDEIVYEDIILNTSVALDQNFFDSGVYKVTVKVLAGEEIEFLESKESTITNIMKYNKPIISDNLINNKINWSLSLSEEELLTIAGYEIKVVNKTGRISYITLNDINTKEFELGDDFESGIYKISVKVFGDGKSYIASQFCDEKEVCKLEKVQAKVQRENKSSSTSPYELVWESVDGATSYIIILNDTEVKTVTSTNISIESFNSIQSGENTIKIKVNGDESYYINSKVGQTTSFNIIDSEDANLRIENGIITWNEVENAKLYLLQVNEKVVNVATNTSYELNNLFNYGDYSIKIKVISLDDEGYENVVINSMFSKTINAYKLKTPESVKVEDGLVNFENIEYKTIEEDIKKVYHVIYGNCNEKINVNNLYKIAIYSDLIGVNSEIKYRAIGDSYNLNSDWSNSLNQVYGKQLAEVKNVHMENGVLYWDSVENSTTYKLTATVMENDSVPEKELITTATHIEKPFLDEMYEDIGVSYNISIVAIGTHDSNGTSSVYTNSKPVEYVITYLPQVLYIESKEGVLTWSGTSENGYDILIDDVIITTNEQYYNFETQASGKHNIRIRLKGNNEEIIDGSWSNEVIVYKLSVPEEFITTFLKDGNIAWSTSTDFLKDYGEYNLNSLGLFKYVNIKINNNDDTGEKVITKSSIETTKLNNETLHSVINAYFDDINPGTYSFRLKNLGISGNTNTNRFINSHYSNEFIATILSAPEDVRIEDGILKWRNVDNNNGYIVKVGNLIYNVGKTQNNDNCKVALNELGVGEHNITIRTLGDSERYITSKPSEEIKICILSTPDPMNINGNAISVINGELAWIKVDKALGYNLKVVNAINDAENIFEMVEAREDGNIIYYELPETLPAGKYNITIMSVGNGSEIISSKYTTEEKEVVKLDSIENFGNTLGRLSFNQLLNIENEKINKYKIYVNSLSYNLSNENEFEIIANTISTENESASIQVDNGICYYELPDEIPSGTLVAQIKAIGSTDEYSNSISYVNSSYTNMITAIKLESVTDLFIQEGVIKWTYSSIGRLGFYMAIEEDGILEIDTQNLITAYSAEFPREKAAKTYNVYLKVVGNTVSSDEQETRYLCSNLSKNITIEKLHSVNGFEIKDGILVWDEVENATSYELNFYKDNQSKITLKSKIYSNDYKKCIFEPIGLNSDEQERFQSGKYNKVTIRAIGGSNHINSQEVEITNIYKIVRPASPDVLIGDNQELKLKWQIVSLNIDSTIYLVKKYRIKLVSETGAIFTKNINYDEGDMTASSNELSQATNFEFNLNEFDISSGKYLLSIQACALPRINGNNNIQDIINSDYSINISITKPDTPSNLIFEDILKAYTWTAPVVDSSLNVSYEISYLYSNIDFNNISENDFETKISVNKFITDDNFFYPTKLGYYKVVVKAIVSGSLSSDYIGKNNYLYSTFKAMSSLNDETANLKLYIRNYGIDCLHNLFESGDGSLGNPYKIKTIEQLSNLNYYYIGDIYFELINDINMNNSSITIGTKDKPFGGILNGNNLNISGLLLNGTNESIGLFAYVNGATIKNLILNANVTVTRTAQTYTGLLVGYADNLNLENILIKGSINQTSTSNILATFYIGGAVGFAKGESTSFVKVKNQSTINSKNTYAISYVGGIVGAYTASEGNNSGIINCGNEGNITGTIVGGIVGLANCPINNAYNLGTIRGEVSTETSSYVGGIIGRTQGSNSVIVENAYNTGSIIAISTNKKDCYAGGLLGYGIIEVYNFYNSGEISTSKVGTTEYFYGWLIGYNYKTESYCEACYNINSNIAKVSANTAIINGCETIEALELYSAVNIYLNNNFDYDASLLRIILLMENELL